MTCLFDRPDGQVTMQVTAPDTITSWVTSAFAISSDVGLGIASDTAKVSNVCFLFSSVVYRAAVA